MSNNFGAEIDYFSASFVPDSNGLVAGFLPESLVPCLRDILKQAGMEGVAFTQRPAGMFSYLQSYNISRPSHVTPVPTNAGLLAYSPSDSIGAGANPGLLLSLNAAGCMGLDFEGLMGALCVYEPRITRVDMCVDYLYGEVSYQQVVDMYDNGAFVSGGRPPRIHKIEPKIAGEKAGGYTLYVGKGGYAKYFRCYEKAYQLASIGIEDSPFKNWLRLEVEIRNHHCEIPYQAFYDRDAFLLGMYPGVFSQLPYPEHVKTGDITTDVTKLAFKSPQAEVTLEHLTKYACLSYGPLINVMRNQLNISDKEIVDAIIAKSQDKVPSRLRLPAGLPAATGNISSSSPLGSVFE